MTEGWHPDQDLSDRLRERLQPDHFALYRQLHAAHFHHWKVRRVSNPDSLRRLRLLLHLAGVVRLQPTRAHANSQVFHEYAAELGLRLDGFDLNEWLTGQIGVLERQFSEPGDGYAMYPATETGWISHALADTPLFSIDETLRNCLREEACTDGDGRLSAFRTSAVDALFARYEVASVVDAVAGVTDPNRPIDAVAAIEELITLVNDTGTAHHDHLLRASQHIGELLRQGRSVSRQADQAPAVFTMLGFLIDELVARSAVGNGMGFSYRFTKAVLAALTDRLPHLRDHLATIDSDVDGLAADLHQLAGASAAGRPAPEGLEQTADRLRDIGFGLRRQRRLNEEDSDTIFTASNTLWRWSFFLEHCARPVSLSDTSSSNLDRVADLVLRWVRRPWAILTVDEVQQAFRGLVPGDEHDNMPRGFSVLVPMVTGELESFFATKVGVVDPERARSLVRRLIICRYLLYVARRRLETVTFPPSADRFDAAVLVELFSRWVYADDGQRVTRLDQHVTEIISLLRSGAWCEELLAGDLLPQDADVARRYRAEPAQFAARLFRFGEPGFQIEENLGFMPPERFTFVARTGRR